MPVAAIYDIHGNLPSLEAVLAEIRRAGVEHIVVGGDVLPGPMARECLDLLRSLEIPTTFIRGNGERVVVDLIRGEEPTEVPPAYRDPIRRNAQQLTPEDAAWIGNWPETLRMRINGSGEVLFCHATPRNDWEIFTTLTPEEQLAPVFTAVDVPLVVCGHTHM
jgi:predicted phosphodiesterase